MQTNSKVVVVYNNECCQFLSKLLSSNKEELLQQIYDWQHEEILNLKEAKTKTKIQRETKLIVFHEQLSNSQLCCYFCISQKCLQLLCDKIMDNIGLDGFKNKEYLRDQYLRHVSSKANKEQMEYPRVKSTGILVSEEVKLASTLCFLASGS